MTRFPTCTLTRVSLCSSLAIATSLVVGPSPAAAQAFQGTVSSSSGISTPVLDTGTTTIDVTAPQAVINWDATGPSSGGVTTFQSSGTTATFQGESNFAVLNRVAPGVASDGIFMDGMINSLVGGQVGGTVYFYSPNGIVIGQNASINVGSLGLTTSPIADDGEGSWMSGFGTSSPKVTFGAANPGSYVRTDTAIDGSINANGFGSYVALVAPTVQHNGVIRTDSGVALVGAEAATITFNQDGLYNIEVTTGTDGGVTVDGGTITRNSQTIGGDRHAYLVAVPKNNAITLLVTNGADLGFDIAGSAGVEGNSIVLSAGHDVNPSGISEAPSAASGALADINVTNSNFTSALYGRASGEAIVGASGGGSSDFTSDVSLRAGNLVQFTSGNSDSSVTVGGNLTLSANADASSSGESVTAGTVQLMAFDGGSLSVVGSTNVSAVGTGGFSATPGTASGDGTGGTILVQSTTGGEMSLGNGPTDTFSADASGHGGGFFTESGFVDGGSGFGGTVNVFTSGGSSMTVTGDASLLANGEAGQPNDCSQCAGIGGIGDAGTINVQAHTGPANTMDFAGGLSMTANGEGGDSLTGDGGLGLGGEIYFSAQSASSATATGDVSIQANGVGGDANGELGDGGIGNGGIGQVRFGEGATTTINGNLTMVADGYGGNSSEGNGGAAQGGLTYLVRTNGTLTSGSATVNGNVTGSGNAFGGTAFGDGAGGNALGGLFVIGTDVGTITVTGFVSGNADGFGGGSEGGIGGNGTGGSGGSGGAAAITLGGGGGSIELQSGVSLSASGYGGEGMTGGDGVGGEADIRADGGDVTIGGFASVNANGTGGSAFGADGLGGNGGIGRGGEAEASATNAILAFGDALTLSASGFGGSAGATGATTGAGFGGFAHVEAITGGSLTVAQGLDANATGEGGAPDFGVFSGNGTGGTITIRSRDGGSTLTVAGAANLNADGEAGYTSECSVCGNGGIGHGGTITVSASGVFSVDNVINKLDFGDTLFASVNGYGGDGVTDAAGDGFGGIVTLSASDGNSVGVTGLATLEATGWGGYDYAGLVGGSGTGGTAQINTVAGNAGNSVTLDGAIVNASGWGGDSGSFVNGDGGDGFGGTARMYSPAGTIHVTGDVTLEAEGYGGDTDGVTGIGGDGFGSLAELVADGGDITIDGSAFVDASGYGGDAFDGGDGFGGGDPDLPGEDQTEGAYIFARNGDIRIGVGDVETGAFVESNGFGGFGLDNGPSGGGSGGNGSGGFVSMLSGNSDLGASSITAEMTFLSATGVGGDGGNGSGGGSGDPGGNGGTGTGGLVGQTAGAGNGLLAIGNASVDVSALGGRGGDGGSADGGVGGDGGNGGAAIGGFSNVGTASHNPSIAQAGLGDFGSITIDASAVGGDGGNGGIFGSPDGNGGAGGSATGGRAVLLVRGSTLDVGSVGLVADATGGNGGSGNVVGDGGNATGGSIGVLVTKRFEDTPRGQLIAGSIIGFSSATGGAGLNPGASLTGGGSLFQVTDSDASIGSLAFTVTAGGVAPGAPANAIRIINGEVDVLNDFTFITPGDMSLLADIGAVGDFGGSMTVGGALTLTAGNFVPDAGNEPPVDTGTYFANAINITSGLNIYTTANLDSQTGLNLTAAGFVVAGNLNGNSGDVIVDAQGGLIQVATINGGFVNLQASDSVTTGDINSDSNIQVGSGADMTLGNLVAGLSVDSGTTDAIRLDSGGSILLGNAIAADGIDFSAGGSVTGLDITTGTELGADADGAVSLGNISAGLINPQGPIADGFSVELSSGTSISIGSVAGAEGVSFASLGALTTGNITAGTDVLAMASGNMNLGDLLAGTSIALDAGGNMAFGNATAQTGSVQASAAGAMSFLDISAGTFVTIDPTDIVGGDVTALAGDVDLTGDSIDIGNVSASDNVFLTALTGDLSTGTIGAGIDVILDAAGDLTTSDITAGGLIDATGASLTLGNLIANSISLTTTVADLTVGDVTIPGDLTLHTAGDLIFGDLVAFDVDLAATGAITGGDIDSATDIIALAGTNMSLGDLEAGGFFIETFLIGNISLTAGGQITTLTQSAFGAIDLTANGGPLHFGDADALFALTGTATGNILGGNISAGEITLDGNGVTTGNLSADGNITLDAAASILTGTVDAFGDVLMDAVGNLTFGDASGNSFDLVAGGSIDGGDIFSDTDITALAGGGIDLGDLTAGGSSSEGFSSGSVDLIAGASINTGAISAFGDVQAQAVGDIATGAIDAQGFVELFAGGDVSTGDIFAVTDIFADADSGAMVLGDLDADDIELFADTAMTFGNVTAGTEFDFESNGPVTGGNITAGVFATGDALGAITLGTITAGLSNPQTLPDDGFSVGFASETSITTGDVTGAHAVGLATFGPLVTGDINAGEGFMALVSGDMTIGSITTNGDGHVYLADASMFIAAGGVDNFDPSLVLAAGPVATGGSITINGPVLTGLFQAAAGTGLSAGAIAAQAIEASAGGTATVNGNWSANDITLASNDIDITASGFLNAGLTGPLTLISTNATQALIGDGLTGTGYALSNAEFGRLHGGAVSVLANGDASAAHDMLIGDLSITGPLAGSTIDNPNGIVLFATGDVETLTPGGVIRVVGDVEATGFQAGNALEFQTGVFELDAETGSISVEGLNDALGGILDITADRIHVASGAILDQLAADPHYAGYQQDLNAPAAVQRPDGVIRASQIFVQPTEAVLVQNTGTTDTPAGFVANSVELTPPEGAQAGSIELIVNGQLVTDTGTLTGIAARDAFVADTDLSVYSANSTINGCLLVGPCEFVPPTPEEPPIDPVGGIAAEITLISRDVLAEQPFGNEPVIDDEEGAGDDESSSAIEPPAPLFDTRPLNPDADIDEPISGSGNPALMGAGPVNEGDQQ